MFIKLVFLVTLTFLELLLIYALIGSGIMLIVGIAGGGVEMIFGGLIMFLPTTGIAYFIGRLIIVNLKATIVRK